MPALKRNRLGWLIPLSLLLGGVGVVFARELDSKSNRPPETTTPFALAAADAKGAVVVDGANYRGISRAGVVSWTVSVGAEPLGYNVRCLRACPEALIAPYSYYPEQKDSPATLIVAGETQSIVVDPELSKSQTLWADVGGATLRWELTAEGVGTLVALTGDQRIDVIADVPQAPWVTVLAEAPHPVLAVWASRGERAGSAALVEFIEQSWRTRWITEARWETVCTSGTGGLVLLNNGEVTTMDVETGAQASEPFDTGPNFGCTGTPSGPLISSYIDAEDGSTTTMLRGMGFECSGSLDGRYLVTSAGRNVVAFSAGQHRAIVLSACAPAQVINDVFGALAVGDETTVVLDAAGKPRWIG